MLLYLAFLSACAFTLQGVLLRYNPVSKVAVFKSTNPVFGAVFSLLNPYETDKSLSWFTLPALVLVCAGIFVINKFGERKLKPSPDDPPNDEKSAKPPKIRSKKFQIRRVFD